MSRRRSRAFSIRRAPAPSAVARRDWTREWWDLAASRYSLVTSIAVLEELENGVYPGRDAALALLQDLPLLEVSTTIAEIVEAYIRNRLMPADPAGDALHLAMASFHKCDFLITWNCQHLAKANKFGHIRRVNSLLGLYSTELVTPLELTRR